MAYGLLDRHDAADGAFYTISRLASRSSHGPSHLYVSYAKAPGEPGLLIMSRRAIVPIGVVFSLSLICGNVAYLYLSVSFIQMLKVRSVFKIGIHSHLTKTDQATNVAATLLATWFFGMAAPDSKKLINVMVIVLGIAIASFGELKFNLVGFICRCSSKIRYKDSWNDGSEANNSSQSKLAVSWLRPSDS